jgi:hypothetical protein
MIHRQDINDMLETSFVAVFDTAFVNKIHISNEKGNFNVSAEVLLFTETTFTEDELLDNRGVDRVKLIKRKFLEKCTAELKRVLCEQSNA